jgi:hypothetical protein
LAILSIDGVGAEIAGFITSIQLVPEPSLAALLSSAALAAFLARRRRASRRAPLLR